MNEYEMISTLAASFPRSPRQRNGLFECDAELLEIGGELWAITVDEFSPSEDCFPEADPRQLGRNLAVATLSDLFACGAQPAFFLQSLSLPPNADPAFMDGLEKGLAETLAESGCHLCGGDMGQADTWRFTGIALGRVSQGHAITRRIAADRPVELWISGPFGDANLAAAGVLPSLSLELRLKTAEWIASHAAACIDTSGGLWDSLWMLARVNPAFRFELDLDAVPLADPVKPICHAAALPASAVLIGGAGEYELLFAVDPAEAKRFRQELLAMGATRIGRAMPHREAGFFVNRNGPASCHLAPPCPDPREAVNREAYLASVINVAKALEAND